MKSKNSAIFVTVLLIVFWGVLHSGPGGWTQERQVEGFELVKKMRVFGDRSWTDTGFDVRKGEQFFFAATRTISLQKDNPVATCGPEGLTFMTQQQPIPGQNLGALIGRVLEKVDVATDKQTGEKTQREVGQAFFIGKESQVTLAADGRLMLGINENIVGDNSGEFEVAIYRKK